jgi:cytidine diphosphoramidate kinase
VSPVRVLWITGLSGTGKTTVSRLLTELLRDRGVRPVLLDGDDLRENLPCEVGYDEDSRRALGAYYGRLALLIAQAGHTVICATISLYHAVHDWNRANLPGYVEVLLRVPDDELRRRRTWESGALVVGNRVAAEFPRTPDLVIDNHGDTTARATASKILAVTVEDAEVDQ